MVYPSALAMYVGLGLVLYAALVLWSGENELPCRRPKLAATANEGPVAYRTLKPMMCKPA